MNNNEEIKNDNQQIDIRSQRETAIIQFAQERQMQVPLEFVSKFIDNYLNRHNWITSEKLYQWYCVSHKSQYCDFLKRIREQLKQTEWNEFKADDALNKGGRPKKIYLISQKGVKRLMMSSDPDTQEYYLIMEEFAFDFQEFQDASHNQLIAQKNEELLQQQEQSKAMLSLKDKEIKALKYSSKASIYRIYNKRNGELIYIGKDLSEQQNRIQQHFKNRYDIIISQKQQLIDLYLSTLDVSDIRVTTQQCDPEIVSQYEIDLIQQESPKYNDQSSIQIKYKCSCQVTKKGITYQKTFKYKKSYEIHMQKYHLTANYSQNISIHDPNDLSFLIQDNELQQFQEEFADSEQSDVEDQN